MIDRLKEEVDEIIYNQRVKIVFQPIISLKDGTVLGHEALCRITNKGDIHNPEMLFTLAEKYNRLWDLEMLCRTKTFVAAFQKMDPPYDKKLFLNVNPNIMHDEAFKSGFTKEILTKYKIVPNNVIFEITERSMITDMNSFMSTIEHYKAQQYKIAIDDVGKGYSGLNLINDVHPNYIKIDMRFIRDIDTDSLKYALVKGLVELSKVSNIFVIAEGIETEAELETLIKLGVHYGQGYFIQKPNEEMIDIRPEVLQTLKEINANHHLILSNGLSNLSIEHLCTYTDYIPPTEKVSDVYDMLKKKGNGFGMCVIEDDIPVGIITRETLALALSGSYGYPLNRDKPIADLMDKQFLSVDYKTPISEVSHMAMSRPDDKLYDFIVITKGGKYIGTVTIKDLLQKTTEIEVANAKHLNPLTGMPGNLMIEHKIHECVSGIEKYSIAYFDLDNFKAYNDVYGFEKGDLVIKLFAKILKQHFNEDEFVGHIGGDDFVVIIPRHVEDDYFASAIHEFEREVLKFYHHTDVEKGYITAENRHGHLEKFPMVTATCVFVNSQFEKFRNVFEVTEELAGRKQKAKQKKKRSKDIQAMK